MDPPISVLFVDDEPAALRSVRRQLLADRLEVLTAGSGVEALELLSGRRVDVLVSDVDMPEMSGLELCRAARARHPAQVRVLLTANATLETALDAINQGEVTRFLTKPFDAGRFRAVIDDLTERIREGRSGDDARTWEARRGHFLRWLERRFPGITVIVRDDVGRTLIDLPARLVSADVMGSGARDAFFWWTRSVPPVSSRDTLRPPSSA